MSVYEIDDELVDETENAEPLIPAPKGEYEVRIIGFLADEDTEEIVRTNKKGLPYVMPEFEIFGTKNDDKYLSLTHYVPLPHRSLEGKEKTRTLAAFKEFMHALGQKITNEISWAELEGESATVFLVIQEDDEFGDRNKIKRFVKSH